jgi:hypothetical protein
VISGNVGVEMRRRQVAQFDRSVPRRRAVTEQSYQGPQVANERRDKPEDALNQIRDSLRDLRYGSVNIIVQDGVIIQIDRTEKRRLRNGQS